MDLKGEDWLRNVLPMLVDECTVMAVCMVFRALKKTKCPSRNTRSWRDIWATTKKPEAMIWMNTTGIAIWILGL